MVGLINRLRLIRIADNAHPNAPSIAPIARTRTRMMVIDLVLVRRLIDHCDLIEICCFTFIVNFAVFC